MNIVKYVWMVRIENTPYIDGANHRLPSTLFVYLSSKQKTTDKRIYVLERPRFIPSFLKSLRDYRHVFTFLRAGVKTRDQYFLPDPMPRGTCTCMSCCPQTHVSITLKSRVWPLRTKFSSGLSMLSVDLSPGRINLQFQTNSVESQTLSVAI